MKEIRQMEYLYKVIHSFIRIEGQASNRIIQILVNEEVSFVLNILKVIDETLRIVTFSFAVFREAKKDANISGKFHYPRFSHTSASLEL